MKKFIRKNTKTFAAFAVIAMTIVMLLPVFIGCTPLIKHQEPESGTFSLTISSETMTRTILPSGNQQFSAYKLSFIAVNPANHAPVTEERSAAKLSEAITLPLGTWDLHVQAYADEEKTKLAAEGKFPGIVIGKEAVSKNIILKAIPIPSNEGQGTFRWNIDFPSDVETASMKIISQAEAAVSFEFNLLGTTAPDSKTGTKELDTGYYNIIFTFSKTGTQDVQWREILHIYQNLESVCDKEFTDDYFNSNVHTISFDVDGGTQIPEQPVIHGETIVSPEAPKKTGYIFDAWYKEAALENAWNFAEDKVSENTTLYVKWLVDSDHDGTPNETDLDDDGDGIPDTEDTKIIDSDNDDIPNDTDPDDDGDGIPDTEDDEPYVHAHTWSGWMSDETEHWKACNFCGEETENAAHSGDIICPVCNYVDINPEETIELPFENIDEVLAALKARGETGSADNPIEIKLEEIVFTDYWAEINQIVQESGVYVNLDLSDCSAAGNTITGNSSGSSGMTIIRSNPYIKGIILPNDLETIGDNAFHSCRNLTSITIPDSVTTIGEYTFSSCRSLTSVTIPDSVTSIGSRAFSYCDGLTSINIPDSVTSIGSAAFDGCSSLTNITIPDSVTSIGNYTFYNCTSLTSVTFERAGLAIVDVYFPDETTLISAYSSGGAGTYTREGSTWTRTGD
ncbi:MAG: leucine-rich repeat protein [Treponema sp.]|jgi:uncharacterized repeat protein (TIGR02543 family)|nr:leucine-rich repeat protein [Treponema sp.]